MGYSYIKKTNIINDKIYSEILRLSKVIKDDNNYAISNKIKNFCRGGIKCIICNNSTGALKFIFIKDKVFWIHMLCLIISNTIKIKDYNKSLKPDNLYLTNNLKLDNYFFSLTNPSQNSKACMLCMKKEGEIFSNMDNNAHFFCCFYIISVLCRVDLWYSLRHLSIVTYLFKPLKDQHLDPK